MTSASAPVPQEARDFGAATIDGGPDDGPVAAVYRYAARRGALDTAAFGIVAEELGLTVPEVFCAATRLVELHLLRTQEGQDDGGVLLPLDSRSAAALLVSPIERAIFQQRELADRLRDRIASIAGTPEGAPGAADAVEGVAEIRGMLKLAAGACRTEAAMLRPGHGDDPVVDELFDACHGSLDPRVGVRVVAPHRDRADFGSRARVKRTAESGAWVRTLQRVPQTAVVFDRSLAVLVTLPEDDGVPTARQVTDPGVVAFVMDVFELLWEGATPFSAEEHGYDEGIADDVQQSIARLMAQGLTDEVVARRLGMSVRTCRRHIAALLRNLDSVSRFQAGVQAAQRLVAVVA
ncbi:helix-turn-helix transcriptional regulator [Streptomyces sp. PTM05]|uniref:Helix-turn-helix transcriptional regulator n=1 Tax=Streptantibioticus parmotrematis TaxID=2873249 RepID=A0ABS7QU31_9ACTN|nr:helix-turn-helix transcriptional regulator [Streptantibioticus parmotrematis]MBY8885314.1 helix-turn-helix transcriptional regulator [Streptantibioticus parmotrematis]